MHAVQIAHMRSLKQALLVGQPPEGVDHQQAEGGPNQAVAPEGDALQAQTGLKVAVPAAGRRPGQHRVAHLVGEEDPPQTTVLDGGGDGRQLKERPPLGRNLHLGVVRQRRHRHRKGIPGVALARPRRLLPLQEAEPGVGEADEEAVQRAAPLLAAPVKGRRQQAKVIQQHRQAAISTVGVRVLVSAVVVVSVRQPAQRRAEAVAQAGEEDGGVEDRQPVIPLRITVGGPPQRGRYPWEMVDGAQTGGHAGDLQRRHPLLQLQQVVVLEVHRALLFGVGSRGGNCNRPM